MFASSIIESLGDNIVPVVAVGGGFVVAIVGIVSGMWFHYKKLAIEGSLKQQMLDRGMSAEEIQQVITASADHKKSCQENIPK